MGYAYDASGRMTAVAANSSILNPKSSFQNPGFQPFGFQSGLHDPDTGLVQFRARWYDPSTGRWLSKDPILLEGGLNLYAFCGNDPVNFTDPWGLCEETSSSFTDTMQTILNNTLESVTRHHRATEIADIVRKQYIGVDDFNDAMRHAEWNRWMASEIGPFRAWLYGTGHEIAGWFDQGDLAAMAMDLQNNATGRRAGAAGRQVPVDELVWIENAPTGREPTYFRLNVEHANRIWTGAQYGP